MPRGDWFIGAQGSAANYQVLGASPEDDLILETLGVRGFKSAALGAVVMHDSRDNEDMPTTGWLLNVNNLAYREGLGGSSSFDVAQIVEHGNQVLHFGSSPVVWGAPGGQPLTLTTNSPAPIRHRLPDFFPRFSGGPKIQRQQMSVRIRSRL